MRRTLLIINLFTLVSVSAFAQFGQSYEKRTVILIDFVNQNRSPNFAYLSNSIPDAFVQPLTDTKIFEVKSRDLAEETRSAYKISKKNLFKDKVGTRIGEKVGADIAVVGSFAVIGSSIRIQAKAIDVDSGRVKVSKSVRAKTDSTLFGKIDELAQQMTQGMVKALPPIAKRPPTFYYFNLAGGYNHPFNDQKRFLNGGPGFKLTASKDFYTKWLHPIVQVGGSLQSGKLHVDTFLAYYFSAGFTYNIDLMSEALVLRPFIAGGMQGGQVQTSPSDSYFLPTAEAGIIVDYFLTVNYGINFSLSANYLFDKDFPLLQAGAYLGAAYRFK